jgi:hypothetical protein
MDKGYDNNRVMDETRERGIVPVVCVRGGYLARASRNAERVGNPLSYSALHASRVRSRPGTPSIPLADSSPTADGRSPGRERLKDQRPGNRAVT